MAKKISEEELDKLESLLDKSSAQRSDRFNSVWNQTKKIVTNAKYNEETLSAKILEYFKYIESQRFEFKSNKGYQFKFKTPTFAGLRLFLGVNKAEWTRLNREYPDLINWCKDSIEDFLVSSATMDIINPITTIFALKNQFGWQDAKEEANEKQIIVNVGNKISNMKEAERIPDKAIPHVSVEDTLNNLKKSGLSFEKEGE